MTTPCMHFTMTSASVSTKKFPFWFESKIHCKHHRNAIASAMVGDIWHFSSFVAANFTFPSLSLATIPHPKLPSLNTPASTFSFSMPTGGEHQFSTCCAAGAAALSILFDKFTCEFSSCQGYQHRIRLLFLKNHMISHPAKFSKEWCQKIEKLNGLFWISCIGNCITLYYIIRKKLRWYLFNGGIVAIVQPLYYCRKKEWPIISKTA